MIRRKAIGLIVFWLFTPLAEFGGSGADLLWSILPDPEGGYIVVGFTGSSGAGSLDGWILHVDADGAVDGNTRTAGRV